MLDCNRYYFLQALILLIIAIVLLLLVVVVSIHGAELICTDYPTTTGNYTIHHATNWEVRNVWDSRYPRLKGLPVRSFTDWKRGEIWYTTTESLEIELDNASSYRSLIEGAYRDMDTWREQNVFGMH